MSFAIKDSCSRNENFKINAFKGANEIHENQIKLLENIAINEGYTDYDFVVTPITTNGGNYLGVLCHVVINGKKDKQIEELRLFVKVAPENGEMRAVMDIHNVYCNEIFTYNVLLKFYEKIQHDEKISDGEMFKFPKFYGCKESDFGETIVLENLAYQNYEVPDRFNCIDLDFAKAAVHNLAKFHAISYVLQRRDPKNFEELIKPRKGNMFLDFGDRQQIKEIRSKNINNIIMNVRNLEYVKRLEHFCEDFNEHAEKYVKVNKYPVLCHGDYRLNNLLVRYNEENEVESMVAIDYQFIHFGSPVNDLLYFIFGATDSKFRRLSFDFIIALYYRYLGDFLKKLSFDVKDIYPEVEFHDDIRSHMMIGLVVAVHLLPLFLMPEENSLDLNNFDPKSNNVALKAKSNIFYERFNGILEDFVKWGYL